MEASPGRQRRGSMELGSVNQSSGGPRWDGQKELETMSSVSTPSLGPWLCPLCPLSPRMTLPRPVSSCRPALTLQLGQGPSSHGPAPGWCRSARCARAAAGPTRSVAVRPGAGATRSLPALPWHPGSPYQPQIRHRRPQIPVGGQS
jgi:hypothetical protein